MGKKINVIDSIRMAVSFIFVRLNLTEYGNKRLSLTNIMVYVCIVKVAMSPVVSITEIGALFLSLLNYAHKRSESCKADKINKSKLPDAEIILKEMEQLKDTLAEQAKVLESQGKVVEEAKSIMTAQKISSSQTRRQL